MREKEDIDINQKNEKTINIMFYCAMAFFFFWGISEYFNKNYDLIADRFYIVGVLVIFYYSYKIWYMDMVSVLVGLVPLLLHSWGKFGSRLFGIPFDHYLHFSAGFALALIAHKYIYTITKRKISEKSQKSRIITQAGILLIVLCVVAGIGSFLEVAEFYGADYLGEGRGVWLYGAGDFGGWENSVKDMIMNTLGAFFGSIFAIFRIKTRTKTI